jgi:hypothetical protein
MATVMTPAAIHRLLAKYATKFDFLPINPTF